MAKPSKFAHIVYRTRRFEEMSAWYQKVFEAKVQYQNPGLAFLTYDDEHHRFAFANLAVLDPAGKASQGKMDAGVDHVAYTYASLADLVDTYTRLKQHGITPYWPIRHGPTLSLYYRDPFATNPIGVNFDPDELVAQIPARSSGAAASRPACRPAGTNPA